MYMTTTMVNETFWTPCLIPCKPTPEIERSQISGASWYNREIAMTFSHTDRNINKYTDIYLASHKTEVINTEGEKFLFVGYRLLFPPRRQTPINDLFSLLSTIPCEKFWEIIITMLWKLRTKLLCLVSLHAVSRTPTLPQEEDSFIINWHPLSWLQYRCLLYVQGFYYIIHKSENSDPILRHLHPATTMDFLNTYLRFIQYNVNIEGVPRYSP
jgi:hypothetical protein